MRNKKMFVILHEAAVRKLVFASAKVNLVWYSKNKMK